MRSTFGPWSTALGTGNHPEMSAFWKRRMAMLCRISQDRATLRRRTLLGLVATGVLTCLIPTLREAPAHAQQKKSQTPRETKLSGRIYAPATLNTSRYGGDERKGQRMMIAIDPETGEWEKIGDHPGRFHISPDARMIAFKKLKSQSVYQASEEVPGIWVADVNDLDHARKILEVGGQPVWSPDGQWLLTLRLLPGNLDYYLVRPDGSEEHRVPKWDGKFSPDGQHLLYLDDLGDFQLRGREVRLFDLETGEHSTIYRSQTDFLARAIWSGWSPDGEHIALVVIDYEDRFRIPRETRGDCRFVIIDADGENPREFRLADTERLWIVRAQWQ